MMISILAKSVEASTNLIWLMVPLSIIAVLIYCWWLARHKNKLTTQDNQPREEYKQPSTAGLQPQQASDEPQVDYINAVVIKKRLNIHENKANIFKNDIEFWVKFSFEDGREQEFSVTDKVFEKIQEGQAGTLVLYNGNFLDFGDGVDIEENDAQ